MGSILIRFGPAGGIEIEDAKHYAVWEKIFDERASAYRAQSQIDLRALPSEMIRISQPNGCPEDEDIALFLHEANPSPRLLAAFGCNLWSEGINLATSSYEGCALPSFRRTGRSERHATTLARRNACIQQAIRLDFYYV